MRKTKLVLSLLLVAIMVTMAVVTLVACGDETPTLLVWAPSNAQSFYKKWADEWAKNYTDSEGRSYKVRLGIKGENNAVTDLLQAVSDSADVFAFADDQLGQLIAAGAISQIGDPTREGTAAYNIANRNSAGSVQAATANGILYAYPMQADNGWFLYYNSDFFTEEDITNWDNMWDKVEAWNAEHPDDQKQMHFDFGDAWYGASWFYTFGGTLTETGTDFNTDEIGLKALKAAHNFSDHGNALLAISPNEIKADDVNKGKIVALVAGSWVYSNYSNDDLKLTSLPAVTDPDDATKEYPMVSFLGSKLFGVNNQRPYQEASHALADYLTSEEVQIAKAEALAAGPSNINAAESETAAALPTVQALAKQSAHSVPQVGIPDTIWTALPQAALNYVNASNEFVGNYFPEGVANDAALRELLQAMYEALFPQA